MADPTKPREHVIRIGGLMHCCVETVNDRSKGDPPNDGEVLACKYGCGPNIIHHNGAWEWYSPNHSRREAP